MKGSTRTVLETGGIANVSPDAYLSLRTLAGYSGLSVRTLRDRLVHAAHPLPRYRVGGKILVKRSEFDEWMRTFRSTEHAEQRELVTTLLQSL